MLERWFSFASVCTFSIRYLKGNTVTLKNPAMNKPSDPLEMGWGGHALTHYTGAVSTFVSVSAAFPLGESELSDLRGDEVQLLHFYSRSHLWFQLLELLKLSYWPLGTQPPSMCAAAGGGALWESKPEPNLCDFEESDNVVTVTLSSSGLFPLCRVYLCTW